MKTKLALLLGALIALNGLATAQNSVNIDAQLVKTEPTPLKTSEYADVWIEFTNKGGSTAQDLKVSYRPSYPFSVDPGEKTSWDFGKVLPGEEYQVHLKVKVDENAVQGTNRLRFAISTGGVTVVEEVPVEVRSDNNILSVQQVSFPEKVSPGSSHMMGVELENLADSTLKNVQVSLDLSQTPIAAETTTATVTSIKPGGGANVSFRLAVDGEAENGVHRIPITLSYENEAGTEFTRKTTTGVRIGGEPMLEAGVNDAGILEPGKASTVTFRIVNRGYGTANFVQFSLGETDNFKLASNEKVYIGNMESDDYQTAEYTLTPTADPGTYTLPVKLSYRGSNGEIKTVERNVTLEVYSAAEARKLKGGGSNPLIFIVILLALGAGGFYYWKKRG
ncbi:MAG: COG1361 S-layer family protein [Candidatus Nanohaloarchaea archaeon]